MSDYIVIRALHVGGEPPFSATRASGENEEAAAKALGGHFVYVLPDNGEECVVFEEGGEKFALLVEGERPAPKMPDPSDLSTGIDPIPAPSPEIGTV